MNVDIQKLLEEIDWSMEYGRRRASESRIERKLAVARFYDGYAGAYERLGLHIRNGVFSPKEVQA